MVYFIWGLFTGWVLEWLFLTFWLKKDSSESNASAADLTSLKSELSAKNVEIASLKSKLYKAEDNVSASSSDSKVVSTTEATKTAEAEKSTDATKAESTATSSTASATKKAEAKTADEKPVAKKEKAVATKKPATAKNAKSTASASKKAGTKATKKKPAAKKAPATSKAKRVVGKNRAGDDDFTLLTGIGPSAASKINEIGIMTFAELAAMDDDDLRAKLEAAGARLNSNKEALDSWNEQATLASKGDFDGLKKLQASLKK